jgi:hypothetical protein
MKKHSREDDSLLCLVINLPKKMFETQSETGIKNEAPGLIDFSFDYDSRDF